MSNAQQMQELNDKLNQNMMELNSIMNVIAQLPPKQTPETLTITPNKNKQTNRGLYNVVTVDPIPDEYIIPTGTQEINQNGLHDVTEVKSVNVNVKAKAEMITEKDVNFYTPYGDLVASYTIEEANALTELPEAPELPRLTFQEWNYDLVDIQATTVPLDVGGTYTPTSGACEFDVDVNSQSGMTVTFTSLKGLSSIDWGDGTVDTNLTHTYTTVGKYTICAYNVTSLGTYLMSTSSNPNYNLVEVRLGNTITVMASDAFHKCQCLQYVTVSSSTKSYNSSSQFYYTYALKFYVFSKGTTNFNGSYMFGYCYNLKGVSIPLSLTRFNTYAFKTCASLKKFVFPKKMTDLTNYMFSDCYSLEKIVFANITSFPSIFASNHSLKEIDLTSCTSVPTLGGTYLNNINKTCKIKVPANLYENFKTASNWSTYKDFLVPI